MALPLNRATERQIGVDGEVDSQFSDYDADEVMVHVLGDKNGNEKHCIYVIAATTVDPNADTTYDAAPIGSTFTDGPGFVF